MKLARKRSPNTWLHNSVSCSGWSMLKRRWHHPKVANPTSYIPAQNWQFIIATLNQWLGCFRVKPRAEIWHQKRQSVPLPPPINRFDLHAPEMEKFGSKIDQKPASNTRFLQSSLSLSLCCSNRLNTLSLARSPPYPPQQHHREQPPAPPGQLPSFFFFFSSHVLHCSHEQWRVRPSPA